MKRRSTRIAAPPISSPSTRKARRWWKKSMSLARRWSARDRVRKRNWVAQGREEQCDMGRITMAENALREMTGHRRLKLGHLVAEFATPGIGHILKSAGCDFVF